MNNKKAEKIATIFLISVLTALPTISQVSYTHALMPVKAEGMPFTLNDIEAENMFAWDDGQGFSVTAWFHGPAFVDLPAIDGIEERVDSIPNEGLDNTCDDALTVSGNDVQAKAPDITCPDIEGPDNTCDDALTVSGNDVQTGGDGMCIRDSTEDGDGSINDALDDACDGSTGADIPGTMDEWMPDMPLFALDICPNAGERSILQTDSRSYTVLGTFDISLIYDGIRADISGCTADMSLHFDGELMGRISGSLDENAADAALIAVSGGIELSCMELGTGSMDMDFTLEYMDEKVMLLLAWDDVQPVAMADNSFTIVPYDGGSDRQIVGWGGTTVIGNGIIGSASKTIQSVPGHENLFDITLTAEFTDEVFMVQRDPDLAIVIVIDVSNSMLEDWDGRNLSNREHDGTYEGATANTKYEGAIIAARQFVDLFTSYTHDNVSKLGVVAFNTDAYELVSMSPCDTPEKAGMIKDEAREGLKQIITRYNGMQDYDAAYHANKRFTNMEAGLSLAGDMLSECSNENKFIVFLTDGLPTTYMNGVAEEEDGKRIYRGYTATSSTGKVDNDGVFYSRITKRFIEYGVNYSDKGAVRARKKAQELKDNGIGIFSIGAGLNTFAGTWSDGVWKTEWHYNESPMSGSDMIRNQLAREIIAYNVSTIDNNFTLAGDISDRRAGQYERNYNVYLNVVDEMYSLPWEVCNFRDREEGYYYRLDDRKDLFENWLKYGIGSNSYYDAANEEMLEEAITDLFEKIVEYVEMHGSLFYVDDPMSMSINMETNIKFLGFFAGRGDSGPLYESLSGSHVPGGENATMMYGNRFRWNLETSGYDVTEEDGATTYVYTLTYRIRLANEEKVNGTGDFKDSNVYDTNGTTTLMWAIYADGEVERIETMELEVPSVRGYLSSLTFKKMDDYGSPVKGAVFGLRHDTDRCHGCKDGVTDDYVWIKSLTAISDDDGMVSFTDLPSGHAYLLHEREAPDGYMLNETMFPVIVAYGSALVGWADGYEGVVIDNFILTAPATGGMGTWMIVMAGSVVSIIGCAIAYKNHK